MRKNWMGRGVLAFVFKDKGWLSSDFWSKIRRFEEKLR